MSATATTTTTTTTETAIFDLVSNLPGTSGQPTSIFGLEANCPESRIKR